MEFEDVGDDGQLVSGEVVLTPKFPLAYFLINGEWFFSYKNMGELGQLYWAAVKRQALDPNGINLNMAFLTPIQVLKWRSIGCVKDLMMAIYSLM